jgi:hypothetical protein
MNLQKWTKRLFYTLMIGWIPYMIICGFGMSFPKEIRVPIVFVGLFLCFMSAVTLNSILRDGDLFKSIEELDDAKHNYIAATKRLEEKIKEL